VLARKYLTVTARLSDHEHLMQIIALNDTSGFARLVDVVLRNAKGGSVPVGEIV